MLIRNRHTSKADAQVEYVPGETQKVLWRWKGEALSFPGGQEKTVERHRLGSIQNVTIEMTLKNR